MRLLELLSLVLRTHEVECVGHENCKSGWELTALWPCCVPSSFRAVNFLLTLQALQHAPAGTTQGLAVYVLWWAKGKMHRVV